MRRIRGVIIGVVGVAAIAGLPADQALAATSIDALTINGNPGAFLLHSGSIDMDDTNATLFTTGFNGTTLDGQHNWRVDVSPPLGLGWALGTYPTARDPDATHAMLDLSGDGRGCNSSAGTITVEEVTNDPSTHALTALALSYQDMCTPVDTAPVSGELRWHSTVDYVAAGVPDTFYFGNQGTGVSGVPHVFTVRSDGTSPLILGAVNLGGGTPSAFSLTNDGCSGQTIQPGQTCSVTVVPHPASLNLFNALLQIPDNVAGGQQYVRLSVNGVNPPVGGTQSLAFGGVQVGTTSPTMTATKTITGTTAVTFGTASVTGTAAAYTIGADTCSGATLSPGQQCTIGVTAHPTALGVQAANLVLPDNTPAGSETVDLTATGVISAAGTYYPLSSIRILDTRNGNRAPIGPGGVLHLQVAGNGGVAATGVSAVVLNVTVTSPTAASYLAVYPTGTPRPDVSNLNFNAGWTGANNVTVPLGANGQVDIYNFAGRTQVIADVLGFYAADDSVTTQIGITGPFGVGGQYQPVTPERLLDTRSSAFGKRLASQFEVVVPVDYGPDINPHIRALAVNVTATGPTKSGFLTAWNGQGGVPTSSTLNFAPHATVPNMAIVPVAPCSIVSSCAGLPSIAVYNGSSGSTDVVVDIFGLFDDGSFGDGLTFHPITPHRIIDSRINRGVLGAIGPKATAKVTAPFTVADANTVALAANLTAVAPTASTYLSVWPAGAGISQPRVSTLNAAAGQVVPNAALITIGPSAAFNIFNNAGNTNVLVDVAGVFEFQPVSTPAGLTALIRHGATTGPLSNLFITRPVPVRR
jgi:hypothetical protein